jgi:hypothetical protein
MKPKRYPYSGKTTKSSLILLGSEKLSNTLSQTLDASVKTQMRNRLLGVDTSQAKSTKEKAETKINHKAMSNAMAKYVIEVMYQADKRDPEAITAVAELIKTSRDIILYSNL